ncbi:MAG TPA: response regulator [Candidatus Tectomicrobia bacterium]|nr:response regulator [Candidatus Tectomicrobia bacterium]
MDSAVVIELIKIIPSLVWALVITVLGGIFYRPIRHQLIPRITGVKVLGVDFAFVSHELDRVAETKGTAAGSKQARDQVARRAERVKSLVQGARILLVNDQPNEMGEVISILRRLGATVEVQTSTAEGLQAVRHGQPDVIISDMRRPEGEDAGLQLLSQLRARETQVPVILSVAKYEPDRGVPPFAFGITNRVDELLHLTFDALERERG